MNPYTFTSVYARALGLLKPVRGLVAALAAALAGLAMLLDAGLQVTVNSDDPAYFGGYVNQNYVECFATLPLDVSDAWRLARAGFESSFADAAGRAARIDEVDAFFAAAA